MSKTVLSFGLTPGDIAMGCGGSLALLANQGYKCVNVFSAYSGENLTTLAREAREAAGILGVADVSFLLVEGGPDMFSREAMLKAARKIRKHQPERVFTFSSQDPAPDRYGLSCLVKTAVTAAADPGNPDLEGAPWRVETVLGYEIKPPLQTFDLTMAIGQSIERKMRAIACYEGLLGRKVDQAMEGLARYRGRMSRTGGAYAEVFEILAGGHDPFRDWLD
ncbi:PIG-L deacetylase family protein [Desulfohalovibrio reitneri]|uniref:PIG-L deacetylase family protein n=1 Tax=Desulfohalovibrio reitneri TaxID=1307759 RepID=UPI00054DD4D4|nr:PIG-L family deacetylase [Desulfohalovibrio reitneri]